ncbi:MAG: hypothetical protein B6U97_01135 [Candidatus Altiarchaeales archaeon ex4484_96]|nr:MAG: hypothetical protein B6U97_01135 [Candidatus Altiarchaeales archaeon ex4484_96]
MSEIMVVDDEENMVELIRDVLESEGFNVVTAFNGGECLNKLKEGVPDLILLDMKMPVMDGIETLEEIKKVDDNLSVVFLSAVKISLAEFISLKKRFNLRGYLIKPVTKKELLDVIGDVLSS